MLRSPLVRYAFAAVAGVSAAAVVVWTLMLVNAESGFARCTATTGAGWLVPILAGAIITGVGAVLLNERPRNDANSDATVASERLKCPFCSEDVRASWRLCPSCGSRLTENSPDSHDR